MSTVLCLVLSVIFFLLSLIHFYWLVGGKWALDGAIPSTPSGSKHFQPGKLATLVVALGLLSFCTLYLIKGALISLPIPPTISQYTGIIISAIFLIRAIGDFKNVGFFKKTINTDFARLDTIFYSPLCLFISTSGILIEIF
jgi:hypothetical protein